LWGIKGSINISGGEPFIRKDIFQILEKIHENKDIIPHLGILTNGSFITREIARRLKELDVRLVQVSLEGMKETNDEIRGKDSFEKIVNAARILVEEGIYTIISFTSSRKNYKEFPEVAELGKEIGVNVVWTDRLVPYGHGKQLKEEMLEPSELKEHYENIHKISRKSMEARSRTEVPTHRSLYFLAAENISPRRPYICPAGENIMIVMPNGDAFPCRRMPIKVGNLMKQSFFEIWYNNEMLWRLRDKNEINTICRSCEQFEKCRGGGRCVIYGYCGDPFAPDPQCWIAFDKLPSPEKLLSYRPEASEEFAPRFPENYKTLSGAKPYMKSDGNAVFYMDESNILLDEKNYLKVNSANIQSLGDEIINQRPELVVISFQISEKETNEKFGEEIILFLQKLKDNKINFKVCKPLPKCLFGTEYLKLIQEFDIPRSCKDCLELFRADENGEIRLCTGKKGPKLKYMNDRGQILEYLKFFQEKLGKPEKCKSCLWLLRGKCNGLCKIVQYCS
jgi:radical SAM protein with 4Fe4S-binding SPASM domain